MTVRYSFYRKNRAKLFRLLNFVQYLVTLPPNLEALFQNFIAQPQIQENMEAERSFMKRYKPFFGKALDEERQEGREQGIEQGIEQTILGIHHKMGFNAEQIAGITTHKVEYIQSVLYKFYKNNPK